MIDIILGDRDDYMDEPNWGEKASAHVKQGVSCR